MPMLILDDDEASEIIKKRKSTPAYRWDEIWDGTYVFPPMPDILHQELSGFIMAVIRSVFDGMRGHRVCGYVNVSDRNKSWLQNVRCPDVSVFMPGNPAKNRFTHWQGGPDFFVEVAMPGDRCREKLEFYSKVGSREALVVERNPWQLELYCLQPGRIRLAGLQKLGDGKTLTSQVIPFSFQLVRKRPRPKVRIVHTATGHEWVA